VSQILDHILVSPALLRWTQDVAPLHANADFPYAFSEDGTVMWRASDHDLVAATFVQTDFYLYLPVIANP
jgi:predicted extracellular nuclease